MNCPKCGAQNIDGVTFCGNCGAVMKHPTPPPTESAPQTNPPEFASGQSQEQPFNQPPPYEQTPPYGQSQPYGQPPPYGQTPGAYSTHLGSPFTGGMIPPKNYMTESIIATIITTLCCCSPISLILGIIAIIKANNVDQEFQRGNYDQAIRDSNAAKNLALWSAIIAIVFSIIMTIIQFGTFSRLIKEKGVFDGLL